MAADYSYLGIDSNFLNTTSVVSSPATPATQTNTALDSFTEDGIILNSKIGSRTIKDAKIASVSATKITTGTLAAGESVYVGSTSLIFDGTNRSIYVSDGTYKVVHIGKATGFY